jgi:hypothetical protein
MNKGSAILFALGAAAVFSGSALAQTNAPASTKGVNAGDNVQSAPKHKPVHKGKMKTPQPATAGTTGAAPSGGTATPGGPNAPVSASGSGN